MLEAVVEPAKATLMEHAAVAAAADEGVAGRRARTPYFEDEADRTPIQYGAVEGRFKSVEPPPV